MNRENDPRVVDILRVVEKLATDRDHDGLVFVLGVLDFTTHTAAECVAIFAALLQHTTSATVSRMHVQALDEETVNSRIHEEMEPDDARRAAEAN